MAAVGLDDMEEKKEKVEEEKGDRVEKLKEEEHSLEGDFQFLPSQLALNNLEQVITFSSFSATNDGIFGWIQLA